MKYGHVFGKSDAEIVGFCDSDYAGDPIERKSTSGFIFLMFGGPISWSSTLQRVTAFSSTEAEYMAISEAMKDVLWLRPLLKTIGIEQKNPTSVYVDNPAALALTKNPEFNTFMQDIIG